MLLQDQEINKYHYSHILHPYRIRIPLIFHKCLKIEETNLVGGNGATVVGDVIPIILHQA